MGKMAAILQTTCSNAFSWVNIFEQISNKISLKYVSWRRAGDKPLSEPMLTHFNEAYVRH